MKRYPLMALLIDNDGNIVENLGYIWINISTGKGTGSDSSNKTLAKTQTWLSSYMNVADLLSFAYVMAPGAAGWQAWVDNIRELIPVTTVMKELSASGYKLKLLNSSGYYALSDSTVSYNFSYITTWNLYNNKGTLVTSIGNNGMPLWNSTSAAWLIASDDSFSDGKLRYARCDANGRADYPFGYTEVADYSKPGPFISWLKSLSEENIPNPDPFEPGGESGTGGGTGNFDGTGDDIGFPSIPTLSAVDTGFITLFNPSIGELNSLSNYMWSGGFELDTFKKLFADPMDCILGLSIVPVDVPNGSSREVKVGNISTGITMTTAASQFVTVDCGTLNVKEFWGAYLDYDPFTKAEIYLPYIGTHPLAVDDIMNKAVHVEYHIDILSGACCAMVKCGNSVIYSFVGQCSCSIPVTANDWTNVINGALSIAASIGSMVATGGASAPMALTDIASTAVNSMKPNVEKSGSIGGMGGMLGVQTPYLILTRPRQALPKNQNRFSGYPSFITRKLSDVSGYTEIESIHLENIGATEQELSEIESLLKGGVIL